MNSKVNQDYLSLIEKDKSKYIDDYKLVFDKVARSSAINKGKPVDFLYNPMFFQEEDIRAFEDMVGHIISIGDKMVDKYLEDEDFRKVFNYSKELEELILVDNHYDLNFPMARFDVFYRSPEEYKLCEFNTDGTSAMNEDNTLARILLESEALKDFSKYYKMDYFELIDLWVEKSLEIYSMWDKEDKADKPNIAILDLKESATGSEFEIFKKAYEKKGLEVKIVDPRDIEYRDKVAYDGDFKIDMVYKRLVTSEGIDHYDEILDFLKAYKENAFISIGSFRSQILHNKIIFKIMHDEKLKAILSEEDLNFIRNHIPFTGELEEKDLDFLLENKDDYVVKPMDMNFSRGVYIGLDHTREEWKRILKESLGENYIYQEFVKPYERDFVVINEDGLRIEKYKTILGTYVYKNEFAGVYTRISKKNVIAGVAGYKTLPAILARSREDED